MEATTVRDEIESEPFWYDGDTHWASDVLTESYDEATDAILNRTDFEWRDGWLCLDGQPWVRPCDDPGRDDG